MSTARAVTGRKQQNDKMVLHLPVTIIIIIIIT